MVRGEESGEYVRDQGGQFKFLVLVFEKYYFDTRAKNFNFSVPKLVIEWNYYYFFGNDK